MNSFQRTSKSRDETFKLPEIGIMKYHILETKVFLIFKKLTLMENIPDPYFWICIINKTTWRLNLEEKMQIIPDRNRHSWRKCSHSVNSTRFISYNTLILRNLHLTLQYRLLLTFGRIRRTVRTQRHYFCIRTVIWKHCVTSERKYSHHSARAKSNSW